MNEKNVHPTRLDRRLNRKAGKSFMPAPTPWLSLALGAATGVVFAYAVQMSGARSANDVFQQLGQAAFLALT